MDDEARCVLVALASAHGVGPSSIARLRHESTRGAMPLGELVRRPPRELRRLGVDPGAAAAMASLAAPVQIGRRLLRRLAAGGARAVFLGDDEYPIRITAHLGIHAPQVLFVLGDPALMRVPGIGIVGSRRPSGLCARAAHHMARELAAADFVVISGGARGVDTLAHQGAVETGATVVCPPVGISRFRPPVRPAPGRCCIVGQFAPDAGWRNAQALLRNRTIVALADAVVAFDPRDRGGTWHSSRQALAMGKPLFVASECRSPELARGVARLTSMGATRLDLSAMPDAAALSAAIAAHRRDVPQMQSYLFP